MQAFWILLLVATAFSVATCDDDDAAPGLDPKDIEAIQEKLAKFDIVETFMKHVFGIDTKSESRDDTCLPIGAECHFWSGPNCCGLRTRCIVFDTQLPTTKTKSSATWVSKCREYKLGVWLDDIGKWFASWG